jgi:hypothetical protein
MSNQEISGKQKKQSSKSSNWTLVKTISRRKPQLKVKKPVVVEYIENPCFHSYLDELSLLVYYVLTKFQHPLPASAIKKEVNGIIKTGIYPTYMSCEQNKALNEVYEKKEIGWVLYEGPLQEFLLHSKDHTTKDQPVVPTKIYKTPRLWCLNLRKIYQFNAEVVDAFDEFPCE